MQNEVDRVVDMRKKNNGSVSPPEESARAPCGFIAKLKSIKHIEVIIAIIVIAVMVLCFGLVNKGDTKEVNTVSESEQLATELQKILSNIKGVGNTEVLIVYNGGGIIEIASKVDKETNTVTDDGRTTTVETETKSPIIVGGKPIILSEKRPEIDGVVVVADGGNDMSIRIQITKAISTLLKVSYDKVQVFEKK